MLGTDQTELDFTFLLRNCVGVDHINQAGKKYWAAMKIIIFVLASNWVKGDSFKSCFIQWFSV